MGERIDGRIDGRGSGALRKVRLYRSVLRHPQGSALIEMGHTVVLVSATIEEQIPPWLRGQGKGWVTAEYDMLPGSVSGRPQRGKPSGRAQEIQRLIGRALRASIDLAKLGERRIVVDCDVLDADGGTRTASITAGYVALREAVRTLLESGAIAEDPMTTSISAVSVGMVDGEILLDLCYEEDSRADVDMNVVATGAGDLVEVQGTGEGNTFSLKDSQSMLKLALRGMDRLRRAQERCLESPAAGPRRLI